MLMIVMIGTYVFTQKQMNNLLFCPKSFNYLLFCLKAFNYIFSGRTMI